MAEKVKVEPEVYIFKLLKKNPVVRDDKGNIMDESQPDYPPYAGLHNPCNVNYKGSLRKMRFIEGFDTIWVDEQPEKIEDAILNNPQNSIALRDGTLAVRSFEKAKLEFVKNHPSNKGSIYKTGGVEPLFELDDETEAALQELDLQDLRFDAMTKAKACSDEEMFIHAKVLGVSLINISSRAPRDISAIRKDYRAFAETQPRLFLETFDDPKTKINFWVKRAIEENVIDLGRVPGQAHWTKTKQLIAVIPDDKEPSQFLTDFTYTDAGLDLKKQLMSKYDK